IDAAGGNKLSVETVPVQAAIALCPAHQWRGTSFSTRTGHRRDLTMDRIREVAIACIGRAVMFGWLAIACVMIGFSFNPVSAFRSGAVTALIMAAVLMWKAATAGRRNPRHTEVWLYLDE